MTLHLAVSAVETDRTRRLGLELLWLLPRKAVATVQWPNGDIRFEYRGYSLGSCGFGAPDQMDLLGWSIVASLLLWYVQVQGSSRPDRIL